MLPSSVFIPVMMICQQHPLRIFPSLSRLFVSQFVTQKYECFNVKEPGFFEIVAVGNYGFGAS